MVKKTLKKKVQAKPAASKFGAPVVDSVRDIWLAGLGAFSIAQQEGGKLISQGNKMFMDLVTEGISLEKKSRELAETAMDDIKGDLETRFDAMRKQTTENWDGLWTTFDDRVSETLDRLSVPTTADLNKLSGRMQAATKRVADNWKELEDAFEKRVSVTLEKLHVPAAEDLEKLSETVQKVSRETTENLGKLESAFEQRVTAIIGNLGIPTTEDTGKLSANLEKLSRQVAALEKKIAAKAVAAPVKPAAKKTPPGKAIVEK